MTDRELLELAARAAGLDIQRSRLDDPMHQDFLMNGEGVRNKGQRSYPWNPFDDDGDALRLAVSLKIDISNIKNQGGTLVFIQAHPIGLGHLDVFEEIGTDPYAATRRAITRAAAEIGKLK